MDSSSEKNKDCRFRCRKRFLHGILLPSKKQHAVKRNFLKFRQPKPRRYEKSHDAGNNCSLFCAEADSPKNIYLAPLSYGIPSALGALDFLDVNASTIMVIRYGKSL